MRWRASRLPWLTARYADIVISFNARSDMFGISAEGLDATIHYGRGHWPEAVGPVRRFRAWILNEAAVVTGRHNPDQLRSRG